MNTIPDPGSESLSPVGTARKAAMLRDLQHAMGRRRRIRLASRAGGGILLAAVALAMWWWIPAPGANQIPTMLTKEARPGRPTAAEFTMVRTDATIVERLRPSPTPGRIIRISDAQLKNELAAAGLEPGFVRTQGRVLLAKDLKPEAPEPRGFRPPAGESSIRG